MRVDHTGPPSSHRVVSTARALSCRPVADAVAGAGIETEELSADSVILETGAGTERERNVRKLLSRFQLGKVLSRQGFSFILSTRFYTLKSFADVEKKIMFDRQT